MRTVKGDDQIYKILERYPDLDVDKSFSFVYQKDTENYLNQLL